MYYHPDPAPTLVQLLNMLLVCWSEVMAYPAPDLATALSSTWLFGAQAASAEAASLRMRLAAESDSVRKQIAELEGKARAAAAERDAMLEKVQILACVEMRPRGRGLSLMVSRQHLLMLWMLGHL